MLFFPQLQIQVSSKFVLFFNTVLVVTGSGTHIEILEAACRFLLKASWNSNRDYAESVDQFGDN